MNIKDEAKIIFIYFVLGVLWIYFSDEFLVAMLNDQTAITQVQTFKGIGYVLITGTIFYLLLKRSFEKLRSAKDELKKKNKKLQVYTEWLESGNEALEASYKNLYEQTEDLKIMIDFINNINKETFTDVDKFLSVLLRTAYKLVPKSDYGIIYMIKEDKVVFVDSIGHDLKKMKELNLDDKDILQIIGEKPKIIDNIILYDKKYLNEEQFKLLKEASKDIKQSLAFSLVVDDQILAGVSLDIAKESDLNFRKSSVETLEAFNNLAESFYTFQRYNKLQGEFQRDIILSMIKFLEIHDRYTGGHSEEVAELSQQIARELGLKEDEIIDAYWAGLVHDIGKLLIPKTILNKESKFTQKDYELIKKHPRWAYELLKESKRLDTIAEYVLYHHERWDGKGYPEGIVGQNIPLISRILAVADSYSAMTSKRAYHQALDQKAAKIELKNNAGEQFDPEIVEVFIKILSQGNKAI